MNAALTPHAVDLDPRGDKLPVRGHGRLLGKRVLKRREAVVLGVHGVARPHPRLRLRRRHEGPHPRLKLHAVLLRAAAEGRTLQKRVKDLVRRAVIRRRGGSCGDQPSGAGCDAPPSHD